MAISAVEARLHELRDRAVLKDRVLYWSSELRGDMGLDSLIANLERGGFTKHVCLSVDEFNALRRKVEQEEDLDDNEIKKMACVLLREAHAVRASDIQITSYGSYTVVKFRVLGMMQQYTQYGGTIGERVIRYIYQVMTRAGDASFSPSERQDGRITGREFLPPDVFSVRVHTEPIQSIYSNDGSGVMMALRLLFDSTRAAGTLEERLGILGYLPEQQELIRALTSRGGLCLVSGPTGHGKTTVLKQIMESMAAEMPVKNFLSMEDPPEYPLLGVIQALLRCNNEAERELMWMLANAGFMRSDPDVIMVGELRFPAVARSVIEAALTGHAIWTTIHASNAFAIVSRFQEFGISLNSLCNQNVLSGLMYQRLLPTLCPECKKPLAGNYDAVPEGLQKRLEDNLKTQNVHIRGKGCDHCNGYGFVGQMVAAEVVNVDHTMLKHLRNDDLLSAREYWIRQGGITHIAHAKRLLEQGLVDPEMTETRLGVPIDYDNTLGVTL